MLHVVLCPHHPGPHQVVQGEGLDLKMAAEGLLQGLHAQLGVPLVEVDLGHHQQGGGGVWGAVKAPLEGLVGSLCLT